jgi:hypothetical protein
MMHRLIMCGIGALLATAGCAAVPGAPAQKALAADAARPATGTIFDTRTAQYFGDATVPLKAYLAAAQTAPAGPQHFCIVGYDHSGDRSALVHWREGNRLIQWDGASDPAYAEDAIRNARSDLDLTKDVVATDADINSSTYLVTRAWVDRVLADCAARGAEYTVSR